jgi:type I restriction enzyme M protein
LFINASQEFEKHPEVRKLNRLSKKNIQKIVDIYRNLKDVEGFSRVVSLDEIKENDYNLNISLYAFPVEEKEEINVKKEWEEEKQLEREIAKVNQKIEEYVRLVG